MGRPAHISEEDLLNAAMRVAARLGPARATVAAIAQEAGVPIGSVYHRVPSRQALLANCWVEAAERFGSRFLSQLEASSSLEAVAEAALVTPHFAREDHAAAVLLLACRREDFLEQAPEETRAKAASLTGNLQKGIAESARRLLPGDPKARERMAVALIGIPYGAVRVFLPQAIPPAELDRVITAAAKAALQS
jgi:AcrR family transcriptional regulator